MDEAKVNEIRDNRKAFLASCRTIEFEAIQRLSFTLDLTEQQVRAIWFEIQGENN